MGRTVSEIPGGLSIRAIPPFPFHSSMRYLVVHLVLGRMHDTLRTIYDSSTAWFKFRCTPAACLVCSSSVSPQVYGTLHTFTASI